MASHLDFEFIESASFYTFKAGLEEPDITRIIRDTFRKAKEKDQEGNDYVPAKIRENYDGTKVSFLAFKRKVRPSCFADRVELEDRWLERKFAYLLIVEYEGFVAVTKRNIPTIRLLRDNVNPIPHKRLQAAFVNENTKFQRFGMTNLDVSDSAMRSKSVEALDLAASFPSLGANTFMLNSFRIHNDDTVLSVTTNSSKINQIGDKPEWAELVTWIKQKIEIIRANRDDDSFLSIFAQPVNYVDEFNHGRLVPISILLSLYNLLNDRAIVRVEQEVIGEGEEIRFAEINRTVIVSLFSSTKDLVHLENGTYVARGEGDIILLSVIVKPTGIKLKSDYLSKIRIISEAGGDDSQTLLEYIVDNGYYVLHFNDPYLRYSDKELFKDTRLLARRKEFLEVFEDDADLARIISEKGECQPIDTEFHDGCLFEYSERKYATAGSIMVCDDLGTEWADHILIGKDSVKLFAAKYKELGFSASAFQEVVGQALKNLGSFYPLDKTWNTKRQKWSRNYITGAGVQTQIRRVRTVGRTENDAVTMWQSAMRNPNYKRDLYLVINFISKSQLEDCLEAVYEGHPCRERNEAIAILWLISSLVSACQNMNIGIHITCQP